MSILVYVVVVDGVEYVGNSAEDILAELERKYGQSRDIPKIEPMTREQFALRHVPEEFHDHLMYWASKMSSDQGYISRLSVMASQITMALDDYLKRMGFVAQHESSNSDSGEAT